MMIIQTRQLVETEVPPQLAARETDAPPVVSLPTYPHALCFSLNSAGFLSQSEWPLITYCEGGND